MPSLFKESLRPLAAAVLLASLLFAAASILVMDRLYGEANALALGKAAAALAVFLPEEALAPEPAGAGKGGESGRPGEGGAPGAASRSELAAAWAKRVASGSGLRVTLLGKEGSVLADSQAEAASMENHASRPEIALALAGRPGSARRESATLGMELFYAAVPLRDPSGGIRGALRIAVDLPSLEARLAPARWSLGAAILFVASAALGGAALFARRVARPLGRLAGAAASFSAGGGRPGTAAALGRLERAAAAPGPEEVRVLGKALASMGAELVARIGAAEAEGRERSAILDGMAEAVLALDPSLRLRLANAAARALFSLPELKEDSGSGAPARFGQAGPSLLEASLSPELEAAASQALVSGRGLETELALYGESGERFFQVFASPFPVPAERPGEGPAEGRGGAASEGGGRAEGEGGGRAASEGAGLSEGVVLVLNDITRLRRLERVRRDFVANVSHELRTPIQLVKGFAEALDEGGLAEPEKAARFVKIIGRQASRMESLIEDLLSLASLEQEGQARLQTGWEELDRLFTEALASLEPKAEAKGIELSRDCPDGLSARVNGGLLVQALVNLLDNAIKYSPPGGKVSLSARSSGAELLIEVRDRGIGIPAKDLPRLFERFYRVDRARSRELGGTGLGLAIVRHIALAHGGGVEVESWEAEGSLFRIRLPLGDPPPEAGLKDSR